MTVAKSPYCFAHSDITISAFDNFAVNQQQLKTDNDSIQPLNFVSTQNKIKTIFIGEALIIIFQSKNILSEIPRDIAEERLHTQKFQPKSKGCSRYPEIHNPCLMNPNAVKNYSQENLESLDFNLPQTKQPFELSITET